MDVELSALESGRLPVRYSIDGRAFSPPVRWRGVPDAAKELALAIETVTAGGEPRFAHWLAWGIDPRWKGLDEGLMTKPEPDEPSGLVQGTADSGKTGYDAPVGTINRPQRMRVRLLALDRRLDLAPAADSGAFRQAVQGHVLEEAERRFEYLRPE